jgi:hypothetical protein
MGSATFVRLSYRWVCRLGKLTLWEHDYEGTLHFISGTLLHVSWDDMKRCPCAWQIHSYETYGGVEVYLHVCFLCSVLIRYAIVFLYRNALKIYDSGWIHYSSIRFSTVHCPTLILMKRMRSELRAQLPWLASEFSLWYYSAITMAVMR